MRDPQITVKVHIADLPKFEPFAKACVALLTRKFPTCPYCGAAYQEHPSGSASAEMHSEACELAALYRAAQAFTSANEKRKR